jgi:hypothetical protein
MSIKGSCSLRLGPDIQRNDSFDLNEVFYLNISHLLPARLPKEIGFVTLDFFRGLQVKNSPDVTPRQWVISFRRFEGTTSLRNIEIRYLSDAVAYHEEIPQITFTE